MAIAYSVVLLTLPILQVITATPRARIVRLDVGQQRIAFMAGQALMIANHGWSARRPYSIASAPEDVERDGWIELLVGVNEQGVPGPHLSLASGELIDVDGPHGSFTFPAEPEERRFVFIAGGTGIAPLRAMLRHAVQRTDSQIGVLYSARTPDEFAYDAELKALAGSGRIELRQTVTRDNSLTWEGTRGRLGRAALEPLVHDPATLCFVCGPPTLVHEIPRLLEDLGIPRRRIRIEEWG